MEEKHKKVLRKMRPYLLENVHDVHSLLNYLYADEIMDYHQKDEVASHRTERERKEALLDLLPYLGPEAYAAFHSALEKTGYEFVVQALDASEEEASTEVKQALGQDQGSPNNSLLSELDPSTRCRIISEKELALISMDFPSTKYALVGTLMDISRGRLEQIQESSPHNVQLQIQKLFCEWRRKEGQQGTVGAFIGLMQEARVGEDVYSTHIQQQQSLGMGMWGVLSADRSEQFV